MATCNCGGAYVRVHRSLFEKVFYRSVYRCRECGLRHGRRSPSRLFSRVSHCPRCGTKNLKVRRKRDKIDSIVKTPWNWLKGAFGAELHHCLFCRLQFYDFRRVEGTEEDAGNAVPAA